MNKIIRCLFISMFVAISGMAASQPFSVVKRGPARPWVTAVEFESNAVPAAGQESSSYYLLIDAQENVKTEESYTHYVYKILTSAGLQDMSDLSVDFDPAYQQLSFHTVSIYRAGKKIDQLPAQIRTIQREESMDRYLYDSTLTAVINLSDVRVGDIVEYSYTRKGYNPIFDGHLSRKIDLNYSTPFEYSFQRLIVPSSLTLSLKAVNTTAQPEVEKKDDQVTYTWTSHKVNGLLSDNHVPGWYDPYASVLITSFKNWGEMAAWSAKRYEVSDAEMQYVKKEIYPHFKSTTKEEYALEVTRFVQDEIRYLGFESGVSSHRPHSPSIIYNQRFGDCKDKSLLLTTLLQGRQIEAYPMLVNTSYRNKISEQLPSTNAFDHCVVQIHLNGEVYYVDPTISNQGGPIDQYYFPDYGQGLVVRSSTTDIVDLPAPVKATTREVQTFDIDSLGGEGRLLVKTTYTGSDADSQRSFFAGNNRENVGKNYLAYYANIYPDIEAADPIQTHDDRNGNIFTVIEKYKIPELWKPFKDEEKKIFCEFYAQTLESYFNISKSTNRKTPYALSYPLDYTHEIIVNLPEAWNVTPDEESIETAFYQYDYKSSYENNRISVLSHYKTKSASIPGADFPKFVKDHGKMMANLSYSISYDASLARPTTTHPWQGTLLSIITLAAGVGLTLWLYRNYDPQPYYPAEWGQPIGGWLILVAIGVCVTPLRLLYGFATEDYVISGQAWLTMWHRQNYGYFIALAAEHIYNIVYLLYAVLIVVLFFQRRSSAPRLISILYGASCLVTIGDSLLALQIDPDTTVDQREIIRAVISAAVWIPYFQTSLRVKKTFVQGYNAAPATHNG